METNEKSEELLIKAIEEIEEKYNVEINAILHVGKLRVSDSIFMATVASKHRYEAFDAIKELIDVVKNKIGLTKKRYINKMKFIRDSIHGNLKLDDFEIKIIDTYPVQRLRRVKQLGFSYLVYPGANHSRFEHSIGTLYLASSLAESLNLSKEEKEIVRIAALLHDIGHGPFSHVSENILGYSHEDLTVKVIKKSVIADILREKFQVKEITDVIKGKGILGQMLSSELDVDKMDYLLRDSYYTGVAYGIIDIERLISSMRIEKI